MKRQWPTSAADDGSSKYPRTGDDGQDEVPLELLRSRRRAGGKRPAVPKAADLQSTSYDLDASYPALGHSIERDSGSSGGSSGGGGGGGSSGDGGVSGGGFHRNNRSDSWSRYEAFWGATRRRVNGASSPKTSPTFFRRRGVLRRALRASSWKFLSLLLFLPAFLWHILASTFRSLSIGAEYVFLHFIYRPLFFAPNVRQTHTYVSERSKPRGGNIRISASGVAIAGGTSRDGPGAERSFFQRFTSSVFFGVTTLHLQVQEIIANPFTAKVDRSHFFESDGERQHGSGYSSSSSSSSSGGGISSGIGSGRSGGGGGGSSSGSMQSKLSRTVLQARSATKGPTFDEKCDDLLAALARYHACSSSRSLSSSEDNGEQVDEATEHSRGSWTLPSVRSLRSSLGAGISFKVPLEVTRRDVFDSAAEQILAASHASLFSGLNIIFKDDTSGRWEAGVDAGGLTKEFFSSVVSEVVQWSNSIQVSESHSINNSGSGGHGQASSGRDGGSASPRPQSMMMRQTSFEARGIGQPVFHALPDNSIMIKASDRPPMYYMALGRIFGSVAVYSLKGDGVTLPVSLSSALLKFMTARAITADDVRAVDPQLFRNRMEIMMRPNGVAAMKEILMEDEMHFVTELEPCGGGGDVRKRSSAYEDAYGDGVSSQRRRQRQGRRPQPLSRGGNYSNDDDDDDDDEDDGCDDDEEEEEEDDGDDVFGDGGEKLHPLKPGGAKVEVTESNKEEYITLLSEHYLCGNVRREISAFLMGFHELVPEHILEGCGVTEKDLGLILTGMPRIDVQDWRDNCEIVPDVGATKACVARWWECLASLDDEERAKILQFSTGLSHLPAGGFRSLQPKFKLVVNIHLLGQGPPTGTSIQRLPTAHTCFNTIEVPPYATIAELREKLMLAVTEGSGSFGFA